MIGLVADGLSVRRAGRMILNDVSAPFAAGRIAVVLGPNGAGKSTLLRLLGGLIAPQEGRVTLDGEDLAALSPATRARRIGYLPQAPTIHWNLTVRELVALGRYPHNANADVAAVTRALATMALTPLADRGVDALSGGERARALLARVLAGEPDWILADEPLANLDPAHQLALIDRLRDIARAGTGVVVVLHDLGLAHAMADQVVILADGAIAAAGTRTILEQYGVLETVFGVAIDRVPRAGGGMLIASRTP